MGRLIVLALGLASGLWAGAAEGRRMHYSLPADDAARALNRFAVQSGEQVIFLMNHVRGIRTNPVNGSFTAREAIDRLVADTTLRVIADPQTGAFLIQRVAGRATPGGAAAPKENESPAKLRGSGI